MNVQALLGAREALSAAPEAAQFTWRASCTWRNGTHSRSTVAGFTGLGAEQQHRNMYEFDVDHPECFASEDNGATPVEFVLVGLVGCLTAGVAAIAQLRGIQLRSVTATIGTPALVSVGDLRIHSCELERSRPSTFWKVKPERWEFEMAPPTSYRWRGGMRRRYCPRRNDFLEMRPLRNPSFRITAITDASFVQPWRKH